MKNTKEDTFFLLKGMPYEQMYREWIKYPEEIPENEWYLARGWSREEFWIEWNSRETNE